MKKSNLVKVFSILLVSVILMLVCATTVRATEGNGNVIDLTATLSGNGNNTANTNTSNNSNTAGNTSTNTQQTNTNNNFNMYGTTNSNTSSNTSSTSVYGNTNLPTTGIESPIPLAILLVIFGISSVYAYKKINDYKNI